MTMGVLSAATTCDGPSPAGHAVAAETPIVGSMYDTAQYVADATSYFIVPIDRPHFPPVHSHFRIPLPISGGGASSSPLPSRTIPAARTPLGERTPCSSQ